MVRDDSTPGPQRAISPERTELRARITTAATIVVAIIAATFAAAMAYADLRHEARDTRAVVDEIRAWARSFDRDYDRRVMRSEPVADTSAPRVNP